jgi:hypothetical protein
MPHPVKRVFSLGCLLAAAHLLSAATITPIGSPAWTPVDFHLFTAPIGTPATGFAEFVQTTLSLLPEPRHRFHPAFPVGPGDPHASPYDTELASGVAALGFREASQFGVSEFSAGSGVYLAFMVVPAAGAATGSSPDFASGPIIPNNLFPIHVAAETRRNGGLFSAPYPFDIFALNAVAPPFSDEGYSHFPVFLGDAFALALNPQAGPFGSYEFRATMTDQSGQGWQIVAPFQVVPEPGTVTLFGVAAAMLAARRRRKARR